MTPTPPNEKVLREALRLHWYSSLRGTVYLYTAAMAWGSTSRHTSLHSFLVCNSCCVRRVVLLEGIQLRAVWKGQKTTSDSSPSIPLVWGRVSLLFTTVCVPSSLAYELSGESPVPVSQLPSESWDCRQLLLQGFWRPKQRSSDLCSKPLICEPRPYASADKNSGN